MVQIIIKEKNFNELTDDIIIFCDSDKNLHSQSTLLDAKLDYKISTFLEFADFPAKKGEIIKLNIVGENYLKNIFIISTGNIKDLTPNDMKKMSLNLCNSLEQNNAQVLTLISEEVLNIDLLEALTSSIIYSNYEFLEWKTESKSTKLLELSIQIDEKRLKDFKERIETFEKMNSAINLTRDIVNRPGNVVTPDYLAMEAKDLKKLGVKVEVLDIKKLEKLGLNLLVNVGKGSDNPPMLIIMHYNGAGKNAPVHALVGKGITFDTGGYSLKTSEGMVAMKCDMAGAAATLGTIKSLAKQQVPVNVIGVMSCAENMINGKAVKVSDVVKSYNGLTVEINNTDAEGRLVLADAISYILKNHKVDEILDIATLTGACMMALGSEHAAVMSYHQNVVDKLIEAGKNTSETLWQLPMGENYSKMLKSDVADISNIANSKTAGATTAGEFLYKFTENTPWAHIDIAGVAFSGKMGLTKDNIKGATGFGVRLLTEYYKQKVK